MGIEEFLSMNPSVPQILKYIESEARRIASEKRKDDS